MTIGEKIRKARKDKFLTQKDLANKLGTTYQNVAQWERGLRNPKPETIVRIAEALGVPTRKISGNLDDDFLDLNSIDTFKRLHASHVSWEGDRKFLVGESDSEFKRIYADGTTEDITTEDFEAVLDHYFIFLLNDMGKLLFFLQIRSLRLNNEYLLPIQDMPTDHFESDQFLDCLVFPFENRFCFINADKKSYFFSQVDLQDLCVAFYCKLNKKGQEVACAQLSEIGKIQDLSLSKEA